MIVVDMLDVVDAMRCMDAALDLLEVQPVVGSKPLICAGFVCYESRASFNTPAQYTLKALDTDSGEIANLGD